MIRYMSVIPFTSTTTEIQTKLVESCRARNVALALVKEVQALKQALVNGAEEVHMGMLINKLDSYRNADDLRRRTLRRQTELQLEELANIERKDPTTHAKSLWKSFLLTESKARRCLRTRHRQCPAS